MQGTLQYTCNRRTLQGMFNVYVKYAMRGGRLVVWMIWCWHALLGICMFRWNCEHTFCLKGELVEGCKWVMESYTPLFTPDHHHITLYKNKWRKNIPLTLENAPPSDFSMLQLQVAWICFELNQAQWTSCVCVYSCDFNLMCALINLNKTLYLKMM
jgi:hypothetical protein